jgi:conjugal transfer/entry exclusion protein
MADFTTKELHEAQRQILSLRSKSEKASGKLKADTWQNRLTTGIVKASDVALSLIDGDAETLGRDTLDEAFATLSDALRRAEAVVGKFAAGTSQHTLQKNRIAALIEKAQDEQ